MASDKKLNAVSAASDGAYIYAEDSSGNQIKISKADLASVVAGVIGTASFSKSGLLHFSRASGSIIKNNDFEGVEIAINFKDVGRNIVLLLDWMSTYAQRMYMAHVMCWDFTGVNKIFNLGGSDSIEVYQRISGNTVYLYIKANSYGILNVNSLSARGDIDVVLSNITSIPDDATIINTY